MNMSEIVVYIVVLVFSVIIHEIAHGIVALWRGDNTAQQLGRITLNPLPHLDLFGSIILPALMLITHVPFLFAWAKPVPINYSKLKNFKTDIPLTALAGPAANILLAFISALIIKVIYILQITNLGADMAQFFYIMIVVNVSLAVLNLIPIPPLDGSKIITFFMSGRTMINFLNLNSNICFIVLIVLLWTGLLGRIISPIIGFIINNVFIALIRL